MMHIKISHKLLNSMQKFFLTLLMLVKVDEMDVTTEKMTTGAQHQSPLHPGLLYSIHISVLRAQRCHHQAIGITAK